MTHILESLGSITASLFDEHFLATRVLQEGESVHDLVSNYLQGNHSKTSKYSSSKHHICSQIHLSYFIDLKLLSTIIEIEFPFRSKYLCCDVVVIVKTLRIDKIIAHFDKIRDFASSLGLLTIGPGIISWLLILIKQVHDVCFKYCLSS